MTFLLIHHGEISYFFENIVFSLFEIAARQKCYLHSLRMKHKERLENFLREKKVKQTSYNNQVYSFFERSSCLTSIFDYLKTTNAGMYNFSNHKC